MKNLILPLLLLCLQYANAQKEEITFGKFSEAEIKMNSYEKDKDAKGVVLFDKGTSQFYNINGGYEIKFKRHKRVKIFDKSVQGQTEVTIPFYKDGYGKTEVVKDIIAITYNHKDGMPEMKKVEASEIYEEKVTERWYQKKFVFSDVQNGSILEYQYVLETPFQLNLPDWTFQSNIPTIYSEIGTSMIPFYEYVFIAQGISKFDIESTEKSIKTRTWRNIKFQDIDYVFAMKDVPAFVNQNFISSKEDYLMKIDFQLAKVNRPDGRSREILTTWKKLNKDLLKDSEDFGYYLKGCSKYAKEILDNTLQLDNLNDKDKSKKIIEYVKSNFEWNRQYGKRATQKPKEFYSRKTGNAADMNLFTISLLREAGIKADPLILSTRDHGKLNVEYAFSNQLNYVIIIGQTETLFLADATEDLLPFHRIPTRCINGKGLVVNDNEEPIWVSLESNVNSMEKNTINLVLNPETLDLQTKVSVQSTGYESYGNRTSFMNDTTLIRQYYEEKIGTIARMKSINFKDNVSSPYNIFLIGNCETEKLRDKIVVKPFLNLPISENVLTEDERNYPVDFVYAFNDEFLSNLLIPATHTIHKLPDDFNVSDDLVDLNLTFSFENNSLTAKGNCKYKKAIYAVSDYSKLKNHIDTMIKYFNQSVVIEKVR